MPYTNIQANIGMFVAALQRVRAGEPAALELDGEEARKAVALVCSIYESARTGATVTLSPRAAAAEPAPEIAATARGNAFSLHFARFRPSFFCSCTLADRATALGRVPLRFYHRPLGGWRRQH